MASSNSELIGEISGIFADKWSIQVDSASVDLLDTGLVDSVTLVELLLELEGRFGVSLPFEELELEDFRTVARIAAMVSRTRGVAGGVCPPSDASPVRGMDQTQATSGAAA